MRKEKLALFTLSALCLLSSCKEGTKPSGEEKQDDSQALLLHGKGEPSKNLGEDYSQYYDETSHYVYEKRDGTWINQYTFGSDSLIQDQKTSKNVKRRLPNNTLAKALTSTFYSTNMTVHMFPHFPDDQAGWDIKWEIDKYNIKLESEVASMVYYVKIVDDGYVSIYDGEKYAITDNDNMYCMVPHPTIENITYTNYMLFDDELGQQTSIVIAHLNEATFDEETNYYEIENIAISHKEMTTKYNHTPKADNLVFSFKFKLSSDQKYVESAFLKFVSSEIAPSSSGFEIEYQFSNFHKTKIQDMPN